MPGNPTSGETTTVPEFGPEPGPEEGEKESERSPFRKTLFRVVVGLVIIVSFAPWVYIYSGQADRDAPDLFDDQQLAADAEAVCARAVADIEALPGALEAANGAERGEQVRTTTARYITMLDELELLQTASDRDDAIYRAWLADWQVMVDDRLRYADEITADEDTRFLITDTGVDERLDRRLTRLANTNRMFSCVAPTDIG